MAACKKHQADPVRGYSECPGCEVEYLRGKISELQRALEETKRSLERMTEDRDGLLDSGAHLL